MSGSSIATEVSHYSAGVIARIAPGLGLAFAIAMVATALQHLSGIAALSPLIVAIGLGIGFRTFIGRPEAARPGIAIAVKPMLRFAIILLGFQITVAEFSSLGTKGAVAVVATIVFTFVFTKQLARLLGVEERLAELIAAGTSICGASAIIACNTVTRGSDEDVAYALACVTLFGTLAMLGLPLLAVPLGLSSETYGMWAGTTIHEVAQVVGASFALGEEAGHAGTVAKLSRVICLAPLVLILGALRNRNGSSGAKVPTPWFIFGFLMTMAVNSAVEIPAAIIDVLAVVTGFLLTLALGAMGLETELRKLHHLGWRALALGAISTMFITVLGFMLVVWATT